MNEEQLKRFLQRTLGARTSLGPRSTFRPTEPTLPQAPASPPEISTDADYELAEVLGRGGMGIVYRARQPRLDRTVAVKTVRPEVGGEAALASFVCEARVTGYLAHPNIVPVIDLGSSSTGETYLSMKLVDGRTWDGILGGDDEVGESVFVDFDAEASGVERATGHEAATPRTGDELEPHLEIFLAVCNAIAFAHSRGFIHRDIKPANVMLGEFGEVLVMDWGLAVDIAADSRKGRPVTVHKDEVDEPWGTPCYLAPEMAAGRGKDFGPWTDVFLLGATLHEVVMRRPPHEGKDLAAILKVARDPKPPVYPDEVPAELQGILRRAMAADPNDRYRDVGTLYRAVRSLQKHGQSLRLTQAARREAGEAERVWQGDSDEVARARAYALFGSAIAGFEQALVTWPENAAAADGARDARIAFARSALSAGDLALARAQLQPLSTDDGGDLEERIDRADAARRNAARTTRRLRRAVGAALVVIIVAVGFLTARWDDIVRGRTEAERARIDDLLQEGFYELGEGSQVKAAATFRTVLETTETPPHEAVAGLALTLMRSGEFDEAWQILDSHAPDVDDPRFGWIRSELMYAMGRQQEAALLEARLGEPNDALGYFILGVRESLVGHRLEALGLGGDPEALAAAGKVYRRSLDSLTRAMLYSESLRGLYLFNRAHAAGHCRDEAAVKECAELMSRRFPDSPHAWFWSGFAYERLGGHPEETIRSYREALRRDPDNARYVFCLGTALMRAEPEEARRLLVRAGELAPDDAETWCNLGHVLLELGEFVEAEAALRRGHELGVSRGDEWHYPSADWLRYATRMIDVADRLFPAVVNGEAELPMEDPGALADLDRVARVRGRGVELTEAYRQLVATAGPQTHPNVFFRAACAALIAGTSDELEDENERLRLRETAGRWFEESMQRCRMAARLGAIPAETVADLVRNSLEDPGLDPVRESAGLEDLPTTEHAQWIERWKQARALVTELSR